MLSASASTRAPCSCVRPSRSIAVVVRASGDGHSTGKYQPGMKVKVTQPIKLFSVPKHPEGLDIQGMSGEVFKDVTIYKGTPLSACHPIVVKFTKDVEGSDKPVKFQAHLTEEEIEAC